MANSNGVSCQICKWWGTEEKWSTSQGLKVHECGYATLDKMISMEVVLTKNDIKGWKLPVDVECHLLTAPSFSCEAGELKQEAVNKCLETRVKELERRVDDIAFRGGY